MIIYSIRDEFENVRYFCNKQIETELHCYEKRYLV